MTERDAEREVTEQARYKVARVLDTYDLELGEELQRRWLATDETGMSLRELATYVNTEILRVVIEQSEMNVLDIDVDGLYEQLVGDDVSSGIRTRTERRLERNGIDVDALGRAFVSHQAIHTYLRECRNVEQSDPSGEQRRESAIERLQKLRDRVTAVTRDTVGSLQRAGLLPEGDVDIVVDVQVVYVDSGEQFDVFDLIERDSD